MPLHLAAQPQTALVRLLLQQLTQQRPLLLLLLVMLQWLQMRVWLWRQQWVWWVEAGGKVVEIEDMRVFKRSCSVYPVPPEHAPALGTRS